MDRLVRVFLCCCSILLLRPQQSPAQQPMIGWCGNVTDCASLDPACEEMPQSPQPLSQTEDCVDWMTERPSGHCGTKRMGFVRRGCGPPVASEFCPCGMPRHLGFAPGGADQGSSTADLESAVARELLAARDRNSGEVVSTSLAPSGCIATDLSGVRLDPAHLGRYAREIGTLLSDAGSRHVVASAEIVMASLPELGEAPERVLTGSGRFASWSAPERLRLLCDVDPRLGLAAGLDVAVRGDEIQILNRQTEILSEGRWDGAELPCPLPDPFEHLLSALGGRGPGAAEGRGANPTQQHFDAFTSEAGGLPWRLERRDESERLVEIVEIGAFRSHGVGRNRAWLPEQIELRLCDPATGEAVLSARYAIQVLELGRPIDEAVFRIPVASVDRVWDAQAGTFSKLPAGSAAKANCPPR